MIAGVMVLIACIRGAHVESTGGDFLLRIQ